MSVFVQINIFFNKEKIMMKRLFVVSAVVMLAAAFFGCVEQAQEGASGYDAQGRRLVTFNIPTRDYNSAGGGVTRALTTPLAQTTWDYVEVVFKNDTEYYAGAAARGKDISFTLPVADCSQYVHKQVA
jgi:hypothetical protein